MRLTLRILAFFLLLGTAGYSQTIESIKQPAIWLKADQQSTEPGTFTDYSGHDRDATVLNGNQPQADGIINYNPAWTFEGQPLKIPYNPEGVAVAGLMAVYQTEDTTEHVLLETVNALSRKILVTDRRSLGPDEYTDFFKSTAETPVLSTIVQYWADEPEQSEEAYFLLGAGDAETEINPFKGQLAELFIFDENMTYLERLQVETYLGIKYGLTLSKNYVSGSRTKLWDAEENAGFTNHIFGIGRDDVFELYQKQSASSVDELQLIKLSLGALAESNAQNESTLPDDHFIVMGDNNGPLTTTADPASGFSLFDRQWMVQVAGQSIREQAVSMQVDLKGFPPSASGYWMVIDRSGTGNFSMDNLEYVYADSVSEDSVAHFNNIIWDADASGKDAFGFAEELDLLAVLRNIVNPSCGGPADGSFDVEVVGGEAPYSFELRHLNSNLKRNWTGTAQSPHQKTMLAGDYKLTVTDRNGGRVDRFFSLNYENDLDINLGPDIDLPANEEITLDAASLIPDGLEVSYQWESNFGFSSTEPSITVSEAGMYDLKVTDASGCVYHDAIVINGGETGRFLVWPSELGRNDFYHVGVTLDEPGDVLVRVYDLKSNLFEAFEDETGTEFHFTGQLDHPGVYMVVLESPKGIQTKKLVVH